VLRNFLKYYLTSKGSTSSNKIEKLKFDWVIIVSIRLIYMPRGREVSQNIVNYRPGEGKEPC
jgi:hypothetical protein